MNKKGFIGFFILIVFLLVFLLLGNIAYKEFKLYKAYHSFCEERLEFCYCDAISCQFKTSWSSQIGFDKNTLELCKLAKELKDKKTIFQAGCK